MVTKTDNNCICWAHVKSFSGMHPLFPREGTADIPDNIPKVMLLQASSRSAVEQMAPEPQQHCRWLHQTPVWMTPGRATRSSARAFANG
jgi:hypothetical protein